MTELAAYGLGGRQARALVGLEAHQCGCNVRITAELRMRRIVDFLFVADCDDDKRNAMVRGRVCTGFVCRVYGKKGASMNIIRTFQPVRQGTYYTEQFGIAGGDCLNIVDDCGSVSLSHLDLESASHELFNRSSCRDCRFRSQRSGSDLTLADYWAPSGHVASLDDDKGLSLVLLNTQQGEDLFKAISDQCKTCESNYEDAVRVNPALVRSFGVHPKRAVFFKRIGRENFSKLVVRLMRPTLKDRLRAVIVRHFGEFWK